MNQLDAQIASFTGQGYRIESNTGGLVTMVSGKKTNHILHLLLSVVTLGLWLPVWLIVAAFGGERRVMLTTDDAGQVSWKHVKGR